MKKIAAILLITLSIVFNLAALNSAAYESTAGTIEDEAYTLLNVISWKDLKFEKTFIFSNINSTSSGNLAAVFHTKNKNVMGLGWEGNLWSETSYNSITGFYGWNKSALALNFTEYMSPSWYLDSNICTDYKNLGGNAEFGTLINKNVSLRFAFGISNITGQINTTDINYLDFTAGTTLFYTLKEEKNLSSKLFLDYEGDFAARKATTGSTETKSNYSQNVITCGAKLLYLINNNLTYGLYAAMPVTITAGDEISTDTELAFTVSNGLSYIIKPNKLFFETGVQLSLPSIIFHKDADTETGLFFSTFYAGFSFIIGNVVRLDISTGLNPNNGIKPDDIWNQSFNISISARF